MLEGQVDDAIRCGRSHSKTVEIVEGTSVHLGAERLHYSRRCVRAGQTDNLVSRSDQFGDDGGTEMAGCASDEDPHGDVLSYCRRCDGGLVGGVRAICGSDDAVTVSYTHLTLPTI